MELDKLKECLVYFALKHSRKIQRTQLVKLVYLSDLLSYQSHGHTITGIEYISYDHGPWSQLFYSALEGTPEITERMGITAFGDICYTYSGTIPEYKYKHLTISDISILEEIDKKWGNRRLKNILDYTYSTEPFKASRFGERIDFSKKVSP